MPLVRGYGIVTRVPKEEEVRQLAELLQLGLIKNLAEPPLSSLAREPGREIWEHEGRCACGKRAYVFSRCVTCIEKEAAEEFAAAAEGREVPSEPKEGEGELVAEDLLVIGPVPRSLEEPRGGVVHVAFIRKWAAGWFASNGSRGFAELPRGLGVVAGRKWQIGEKFALPVLEGKQKEYPYGITWCVNPDASVTTVHNCADMDRLEPISPGWELHEVNWYNHLKLISGVCTRLWEAATPKLDWKDDFQRLISLLGAPTVVAKWNRCHRSSKGSGGKESARCVPTASWGRILASDLHRTQNQCPGVWTKANHCLSWKVLELEADSSHEVQVLDPPSVGWCGGCGSLRH